MAIVTYPESGLSGTAVMWAMAFWGGEFWVFLRRQYETSTTVYEISRQDGSLLDTIPTQTRSVVGAGVSTCAPVIIQ